MMKIKALKEWIQTRRVLLSVFSVGVLVGLALSWGYGEFKNTAFYQRLAMSNARRHGPFRPGMRMRPMHDPAEILNASDPNGPAAPPPPDSAPAAAPAGAAPSNATTAAADPQEMPDLRQRARPVMINSTPPGAEIYIDGKDTGRKTPTMMMPPDKSFELSLKLANYETYKVSDVHAEKIRHIIMARLVPKK